MNACDLEETKHIALQKFLYLAKNSTEWVRKPAYEYSYMGVPFLYSCGAFSILHFHQIGSIQISLGGERIFYAAPPPFEREWPKDKQAVALLKKQQREFDKNEYVVAFRKIATDITSREKKESDELTCKKLRDALLGMAAPAKAAAEPAAAGSIGPIGAETPPSRKKRRWWQL